MTETTTLDYSSAYTSLREQLTGLLLDRTADELETVAPATPEWRVRDVAAHLGGVCDDIVNGNMAGVSTEAWTAAQVEKRRAWAFAEVIDDWATNASTVEAMMNDIGDPMGQMLFDAWTHEQDVRGALGMPGGRDSSALEIAWQWFVAVNRAPPAPLEPYSGDIVLLTEAGETHLGSGEGPTTTIRVSRFEFLRTVTGRRSLVQVRALECDGPLPEDTLFVSDVFAPAELDIIE